jgi:beta-N-acetylhexosaminidase
MQNHGRLIVSIKGTSLSSLEKEMLKHPMIAGLIFFTENYIIPTNYKDKIQLRALVDEIKSITAKPCFIDQEGGYVQRFGRGFTCLPSGRLYGKAYDLNRDVGIALARDYGAIMAEQLLEFGIISLAPVCDLDAGNTVISRLDRGFHSNPTACTDLAMAYIEGMNSKGMQATGKHFPGHGHGLADSHNKVVVDNRSLEELENNDLAVFINLIKANKLAAVMPAHITFTQIDPNHTAGSSRIWLHDILRVKYGFKGIIVSDCLSMAGAGNGSLLDKTEHALAFGDVALLCHQEPQAVIELCDQLMQSNALLSTEAQRRFAIWTNQSINSVATV